MRRFIAITLALYLVVGVFYGVRALWAHDTGFGYFMRAAEFNAIAARMGCKTEIVDGDLLPMALTRVAECLQVRLTAIEGRLKALDRRK